MFGLCVIYYNMNKIENKTSNVWEIEDRVCIANNKKRCVWSIYRSGFTWHNIIIIIRVLQHWTSPTMVHSRWYSDTLQIPRDVESVLQLSEASTDHGYYHSTWHPGRDDVNNQWRRIATARSTPDRGTVAIIQHLPCYMSRGWCEEDDYSVSVVIARTISHIPSFNFGTYLHAAQQKYIHHHYYDDTNNYYPRRCNHLPVGRPGGFFHGTPTATKTPPVVDALASWWWWCRMKIMRGSELWCDVKNSDRGQNSHISLINF